MLRRFTSTSRAMRRGALVAGLVALLAVAAAATSTTADASKSSGSGSNSLSGAGATFPFPLISQWIPAFDNAAHVKVNYNPIGSGGGIAAITNRNVDFGASDAPLSPDQFRDCKGCVQIPWALSATAVAYNLPGLKNNLHMSGRLLADIYLGKVDRWNDARIRRLNRAVNLPDRKIVVAYRSDNSGTSYNFTEFLSGSNADWKRRYGKGVNVNWPTGQGGRGSSGVAGIVSPHGRGHRLLRHRLRAQEQAAVLRHAEPLREVRAPGPAGHHGGRASNTKVGANNEMSITTRPKKFKNAYPICTYTYVILPLRTPKAAQLRRFVAWAVTSGQQYAPKLLFAPLPKHVRKAAQNSLKRVRVS